MVLVPEFFRRFGIILIVLAVSACTAEPTSQKKIDESEMVYISDEVRTSFARLTDEIFDQFPPEEFNYILIGRSPTPIYAIMSIVSNAHPEVKAVPIPLSEASNLRSFLELETARRDNTLYAKKLFDHFDTYFKEFFEQMITTRSTKKFVIVDYTISGNSLGMSKLAIDWYFRFRFGHDPDLIKYLENGGDFPKTEYLALYDPRHNSPDQLRSSIDSYKTKYLPRVSGILEFTEVLPGHIYGTEPIMVNVEWLEEVLNERTGDDEWHWQGKVIELNETDYHAPRELFFNQTFDDHAPYGAWRINVEPLDGEMPELNESFLYLRDAFFDCN